MINQANFTYSLGKAFEKQTNEHTKQEHIEKNQKRDTLA